MKYIAQCFNAVNNARIMLKRHWKKVGSDLGEADGVLTVDGSDFPKQGKESVGVKRQYCGELGKRANGQAGVGVGDVGRKGYTLLNRQLSLPKKLLGMGDYEVRSWVG